MDVNKNSYIFGFSAILVIIVAAILSIASEALKPMQNANVRIEKMQNILASVGMDVSVENAETKFDKYIVGQKMLNYKGQLIENSKVSPFEVDMVKQNKNKKLEESDLLYPLFIYEGDKGKEYIVPMAGTGLWGPVWGYVAFSGDLNTITGTTFNHAKETPGLGAEIAQKSFQNEFIGKTIFQDGKFVSVRVVKGSQPNTNPHKVDGVSGGTITSNGVDDMLMNSLGVYVPYFKNLQNNKKSL